MSATTQTEPKIETVDLDRYHIGLSPVSFYQPLYSSDPFYCKEYFLARMIRYGHIYLVIDKSSRNLSKVTSYFNRINDKLVPFTWKEVKSSDENVNKSHAIFKIESPKAIESIYGVDLLGFCLKFMFNDYEFAFWDILSSQNYINHFSSNLMVHSIYLYILKNAYRYILNGQPFPNVDNDILKKANDSSGLFNLIHNNNSVSGNGTAFDKIAEMILPKYKLIISLDKESAESTKIENISKILSHLEKISSGSINYWNKYKFRLGGQKIEVVGRERPQKYFINKEGQTDTFWQGNTAVSFDIVLDTD